MQKVSIFWVFFVHFGDSSPNISVTGGILAGGRHTAQKISNFWTSFSQEATRRISPLRGYFSTTRPSRGRLRKAGVHAITQHITGAVEENRSRRLLQF